MTCPNCKGENAPGVAVCEYCGHELPQPQKIDNHVEHNSNIVQHITYVTNVQQVASQAPVEQISPKSKSTAEILCLLTFLGLGGLNRFYVGKAGTGLLYFFTFGGFFIGAIVDMINLFQGNFTDAQGRVLK